MQYTQNSFFVLTAVILPTLFCMLKTLLFAYTNYTIVYNIQLITI